MCTSLRHQAQDGRGGRAPNGRVSEHEYPFPHVRGMKPFCEVCNTRHESYQAHVFATNIGASNKVTASNNASNAAVLRVASKVGGVAEAGGDAAGAVRGGGESPKQRWT